MPRRASIAALALMAATHATLPPALADADETRLGVRLAASAGTLQAFETSDTVALPGGGLALAYGLTNQWDVGGAVSYWGRPNVRLADARVDGGGGDGFALYTNVHIADAALSLASRPSVGLRLRPVVSLQVGVGMRWLLVPELFAPDGRLVVRPAGQTDLYPFAGLALGVSYRLSDDFAAAMLATIDVSSDHTFFGANFELAWLTYGLF